MLSLIQEFELYLCTGYGESETFTGGKGQAKQGACQGNMAALPMWQQLSMLMLNMQKRRGHDIMIACPVSKTKVTQAEILYVDNTDIWDGLEED